MLASATVRRSAGDRSQHGESATRARRGAEPPDLLRRLLANQDPALEHNPSRSGANSSWDFAKVQVLPPDGPRIDRGASPAWAPAGVLHRVCSCGQPTGGGEECEACRKNRESDIQRFAASGFDRSALGANSLGEDFSHVAVSQPDDPAEREAGYWTHHVIRALNGDGISRPAIAEFASHAPVLQRQEATDGATEQTAPESAPIPELDTDAAAPTTSPGLLVEDDAKELSPGQMRKSDFLADMHTEVCAAANAELAAVSRSTAGSSITADATASTSSAPYKAPPQKRRARRAPRTTSRSLSIVSVKRSPSG
jgi:hypothetical protein